LIFTSRILIDSKPIDSKPIDFHQLSLNSLDLETKKNSQTAQGSMGVCGLVV